jgi:hypothetical protein
VEGRFKVAITETGSKISDTVEVALVDCTPEPECVDAPVPTSDSVTPIEQSAEATIEQTGADPPPE